MLFVLFGYKLDSALAAPDFRSIVSQSFLSVQRYEKFPDKSRQLRNIFFLILYEMGMEDKDVRCIMGITQETIRFHRACIYIY